MSATQTTALVALKRLLKQHGSHRKTARALGISQPYFSDIISGYRKPGPKVLAAIANARVER